jgi:hypothetical protein
MAQKEHIIGYIDPIECLLFVFGTLNLLKLILEILRLCEIEHLKGHHFFLLNGSFDVLFR